MPKKNSKTPLYFFAKECKERRNLRGGIGDVIKLIYDEWQALPPSVKDKYKIKCKESKETDRTEKVNVESKSMCLQLTESTKFQSELNDFVKKLGDEVKSQRWYMIKFMTFCKSDSDVDGYNPYYVLGEVGLIEYSLLEGITNQYHAFIKPNKIPLGYRSQCMDSSRDVHKIPLEKNEYINQTYEEIYASIEKFLQKKKENNFYVPLFCLSKDVEETKFGLSFLKDSMPKSEVKEEKSDDASDLLGFCVQDLEQLVRSIGAKLNISLEAARKILNSTWYDYSSSTKCEFHDELDCIHCALAAVKRFAYLISDYLCQYFDIKLTDKHLPRNVAVHEYVNSLH